MLAAENGHIEYVKSLLNHGASVDEKEDITGLITNQHLILQ